MVTVVSTQPFSPFRFTFETPACWGFQGNHTVSISDSAMLHQLARTTPMTVAYNIRNPVHSPKKFARGRWNVIRSLLIAGFLCVLASATAGVAQTTTLTLQDDLSSKMPSGTVFTAHDGAGKLYRGHLVTHPARWFLRRGSMILVFDDPVAPVTNNNEGVFRAGNKMRLLKLGGSLAVAKLADDAVDGAIGAGKARYVAAGVAAALILFQKGGEAKLHAGDTIDVEAREPHRKQD